MFFINKNQVSHNRFRDVTYGGIIYDYREGTDEPNRTRSIVGGQTKLLRLMRNPDSRSAHRKIAAKQRHFNRGNKVLQPGYQEFLPQYSTQTL